MSSGTWQDEIVGDRIAVDRDFHERVQQSPFSNQQWELIMMAVEFEINQPNDPERARIVADTSRLPHVAAELDRIESGMDTMGYQASPDETTGRVGGMLESFRNRLGIGRNRAEQDQLAEAASLVDEYAAALQRRLEAQGTWDSVCNRAAGST